MLDPVYVGGPVNSESIFALVQTSQPPGGRSVQLTADLYAVFEGMLRKQTEGMREELVHRAEICANGI